MKTKKTNKVNSTLLLLLLLSAVTQAQFSASFAFNAVNNIAVATPIIVAEQPMTMTTVAVVDNSSFVMLKDESSNMQSNTFTGDNNFDAITLYPNRLCLSYAIPSAVYWDWKYVHDQAMDLYINYYMFSNENHQNRLMNLAFNDFTCYSNYVGFQQTLEFRAGTGTPFQYSGAYPPVMPNYNPVLVTKTFAAP